MDEPVDPTKDHDEFDGIECEEDELHGDVDQEVVDPRDPYRKFDGIK